MDQKVMATIAVMRIVHRKIMDIVKMWMKNGGKIFF